MFINDFKVFNRELNGIMCMPFLMDAIRRLRKNKKRMYCACALHGFRSLCHFQSLLDVSAMINGTRK